MQSGYEDAFRGIKKEANTNDEIDNKDNVSNKKKKKELEA